MKVVGIYPNGIKSTIVESGWGNKLKIKCQFCYEGFSSYKIDDRYYWYYDEEQVYHIEDSQKRLIVFVAIARNSQDVIDEFSKHKGEML